MWGSPEGWYTQDRVAPESFLLKLKKYDDKLYVRWNNKRRRFEIWRSVRQGVWGKRGIHVMPVRFPNLDNRILHSLAECDLIRYASKRYGRSIDFERDMDNYNDHVEIARELQAERMYEGLAHEELWYRAKREFGNPKSRAHWTVKENVHA